MNPLELVGLMALTVPIGWFLAFVWSHKIGSTRTTAGVISDLLRDIGCWFLSLSAGVDRGVLEYRDRQRDFRGNRETPSCDRMGRVTYAGAPGTPPILEYDTTWKPGFNG